MNKKNIKPIKITIKDNELDKSNINYSHKKIIEMPQIKTQKPKEARYLGQVDHATEKETKLDEKYRTHKRGSEAGFEQQKSIEQTPNQQISNLQKSQQTITSSALTIPKHMFNQNNTNLTKKQWQQVYKNILPSQQNFTTSKNAGYQDYIDEDLEPSDRIDINTTEYRYIGYFSSLRKAIELVWTYPAEAVRNGISGQVELEFIIKEDGHVKKIQIIKSSGYRILDEAIVNAIKLASPFDPLPKDLGKRKLLVNGTFRYILTPY